MPKHTDPAPKPSDGEARGLRGFNGLTPDDFETTAAWYKFLRDRRVEEAHDEGEAEYERRVEKDKEGRKP